MRKIKLFKFLLLYLFLLAEVQPSFAQMKTLGGTVVDENSIPVPGASVKEKGSTKGTVTDASGRFSLTVSHSAKNIIVSFLGYVSQEVALDDKTVISIQLKPSVNEIEAVNVVAVGYGTLDKREITSAVTHVSAKDLLPASGNGALNSLRGKVAGLSITNTAPSDPNSGPSIQLRGASSREAGLGPLFVINGIPGGNVDNLNQNDIESIDVLKGGAASAIYGTRGSNGVIIITTKKGTQGGGLLYDGYATLDYPTNTLNVLSRDEFIEQKRGEDYGGNTNWLDQISRSRAASQKQTLQASGGTGKTNYILSFDYRNAEGVDLRASKEEYGARLNLNHTAENNLYTLTASIAPRYLKSNNSSWGAFNQALTVNPTYSVMDANNPNLYQFINTGFSGSYNPVEDLNTVLSGTEGKYLDWNAAFKLNILKNLNTQVTVGQQFNDFFGFNFTPSTNTGRINYNQGRNTAGRNYNKSDQKIFEWIGNYSLNFGKNNFKILGGYSYNYFKNSGLNFSNQNLPSDVLTFNNLGTGLYDELIPENATGDYTYRSGGTYKNDSKLIAFFGRINYDLSNKYYFSASLRREGSSKFGFDEKWGNFPAASIGWRISKEPFFALPVINELKLRADYGVTGNQDFGSYKSLDLYGGFGYYTFNGKSYQVWGPVQNANYNLRWERAENFNAGIDFEAFTSKLTGSVNYYIRTNKDLLGNYKVSVPPNIREETFANVGTMRNSGLELQLSARVIKNLNLAIAFLLPVQLTVTNLYPSQTTFIRELLMWMWLACLVLDRRELPSA